MLRALNFSHGLQKLVISLLVTLILELGVVGSPISVEVWLWNASFFGVISMHDGVEEHSNFKLFDSSCNCALMGGDPPLLTIELLFSLSIFLPGKIRRLHKRTALLSIKSLVSRILFYTFIEHR